MMTFRCPHCGQTYNGLETDVGAETDCSACGWTFEIVRPNLFFEKLRSFGVFWYLGSLRRYFVFSGRAGRSEFWFTFIWHTIAQIVVVILAVTVFRAEDPSDWWVAFVLLSACPFLAVNSRRLHDTGKSGWWQLLQLVPVVNLVFYMWLAQAGTPGENQYGGPARKRP